jgi:hypothetical protein
VDDPWTGFGRAFAILVLTIIWEFALYLKESAWIGTFCGVVVDVTPVLPYVLDFCTWGTYLLPLWIFYGYVGHPVTVFIAMAEALNRYLFGQSGVVGWRHMLIQFFRGSLSMVGAWAILDADTRFALPGALAAATLLGMLPVWWKRSHCRMWWIALGWPVICAVLSFFTSFLFTDVVRNRCDVISLFSVVWCGAVDLLFPFLYSYNRYGFVYLRFLPGGCSWMPVLRGVSPAIVAPLFIASTLRESSLPSWLSSLVLVHAIQKAHTEPHIFALALFIAVVTLPIDFGRTDRSFNLCISLLVVAKLEVVLPIVRFLGRSRWFGDLFELQAYASVANSLLWHTGLSIAQRAPFVDWVLKVPSAVWAALTGSDFLLVQGQVILAFPSSLRPFYFFDWPQKEEADYRTIFARGVAEHPIEAPVYTSATLALARSFSALARSGKLGLVTCGDFFLFKSVSLLIFVQVVAIEPSAFRIQARGLEYSQQTACHLGEERMLDVLADDMYAMQRANNSLHSGWELRQSAVPLTMYDVTKTELAAAFIGLAPAEAAEMFTFAFCRAAAAADLQSAALGGIPDDGVRAVASMQPQIKRVFELLEWPRSDEEVSMLTAFWAAAATALFDEFGALKIDGLTGAFRGMIELPSGLDWVWTCPQVHEVLQEAVQLGIAYSFLANAHLAPDREDGENLDAFLAEVVDWFAEVDRELVVATMKSREFENAFFEERRTLITVDRRGDESPAELLRFKVDVKSWNVYRVDQEVMRGLWVNEIRDYMFFAQTDAERLSISENLNFLNNMILQSCDVPVGYPALTTPFIESLVNPWAVTRFEYSE